MNIEYKVKSSEELKKLEDSIKKLVCAFVPSQTYLVEYLPLLYEGTVQIQPVDSPIIKIEMGDMQFIGFDNTSHHLFLKNKDYNYRIHLNPPTKK